MDNQVDLDTLNRELPFRLCHSLILARVAKTIKFAEEPELGGQL